MFAIQLAKNAGAEVITTASAKNHEWLKELGADQVIDYHTTDFSEVLTDIDLVFDTMGDEVQAKSFKVLKPESGRLISIVGTPILELAKEYNILLAKSIWLNPDGGQLQELAELLHEGKLRSVVGETFPLTAEGVKEAHQLSETHHAKGKIVLNNTHNS